MRDLPQISGDGELVSRARTGDSEAFAGLFDRHAAVVRAVAWDVGNDWAAVQDITQETFLRAYRQLATLRNLEHFRYWIVGIARQVVREHCRRRGRSPRPLDRPEHLAAAETTTTDDADQIAHVLRLVARLPEQERLAIHVFFLSDRNIAETAQLMNLSRSGAYGVVKRACAQLAQWLDESESHGEV